MASVAPTDDRRVLVAKAQAALEAARGKDQFIHALPDAHGMHPLERPIPAPIGADCPDHRGWPLVIRNGEAWCRYGQHDPLAGLTI